MYFFGAFFGVEVVSNTFNRYDTVDCDEHPIGTNAVVAVITYTGGQPAADVTPGIP
jgi:hypothetical protein